MLGPAAAAILLLGFLLGAASALDMDFHWHLALGQGLLSQGFPEAEPFSHLPAGTPDRQAWLADAAFAVLDRIGGIGLIRAALGVVFAIAALSVWRLALRRVASPAVALIPVAVYLALAVARLRVRPDLVSLALLPIFVEMTERRPSWRGAGEILILSALWANLHPGSLMAGLLAVAQTWPLDRPRVVNAVAAWAGLCLTPEGIHGLLAYTADTTPLRPLIPEWQRLWERPWAEFAAEWWVAGGVLVLCAAAGFLQLRIRLRAASGPSHGGPDAPPNPAPIARGFEIRELARALLGLALAASAVRFLYALVLPALWATWVLGPTLASRATLRAAALAAAVAALVLLPCSHIAGVWSGIRSAGVAFLGPEPPGFPVEAARFLEASELSGNLAHPARWGGYLAWKLDRRFKTATDGRVTHFGAELAREWSHGVDSPARDEIFADRGIDFLVIPAEMFPPLRYDDRYEPLHVDPVAVVLIRPAGPHGPANVAAIRRAAKKR